MTDTHKPQSIVATEQQPSALMHPMVAKVLELNPSPETVEKMMDLQERWQRQENERLFDEAMVELKRALPAVIGHDKRVSFSSTNYTHASLANVVGSVTEICGDHGFSISWDSDTTGKEIVVSCRVAHRAGHKRLTTMSSPIDTSGSKGACQARMSTVTMLQRYTLVLALGLATGDMEEPHGPRVANADKIDELRNAKAVIWLSRRGITEAEAVDAMGGTPSAEWTARQLTELTTWVRERSGAGEE
jgi:hypothetical protein